MKPCVFLGASWKMNKTLAEAIEFCEFLSNNMPKLTQRIQPFIIPSFTCLREVSNYLKQHDISCITAAQNMHHEDKGEFTGEISPSMIKDAGATIVQLGSRSRRTLFAETDALIQKKVHAAIKHGLKPAIFVGDTLEDKICNSSIEVVLRQIKMAIAGLSTEQLKHLMIVYQPHWASGSGNNAATPGQVERVLSKVRQFLISQFDAELGNKIPLLYSGNINEENASSLIIQPNVDGLIIGQSSLDPKVFCNIISQTTTIFR